MTSTLVSRNLTVNGRRTSVRLEPAMWDALGELCVREGKSIHQISNVVSETAGSSTLTAGLRVHILQYFREAATEPGHQQARHGLMRPVLLRATPPPDRPMNRPSSPVAPARPQLAEGYPRIAAGAVLRSS